MKINLGELVDRAENKRKAEKCTETIEVIPLSDGARVRLVKGLEKVMIGLKELEEQEIVRKSFNQTVEWKNKGKF